jgi:hypothetical protein
MHLIPRLFVVHKIDRNTFTTKSTGTT